MSTVLDKPTSSGGPGGSRSAGGRTYASYSRPLLVRTLFSRDFAVVALLFVVLGYANVNVPNFDSPLTLYYLFLDVAPILLMALPMTLIIITGEIDLSVASTLGLASVMVGIFHQDAGLSIPTAALLAVLVGALCGAFNGFLVAYVGLPSLAVTIGTLALFRGLATGPLGTTAITDYPERWTDLVKDRLGETSYPVVLVPIVVLAVVFGLLLHFTSFGRGVVEIGLNDEAARFTGVNVARTKLVLFVLAGAVAGLAGVYYTLRFGSARYNNGETLELQVIAAVLLGGVSIFGGRGGIVGPIAGVLLIGALASAMRLSDYATNEVNIVTGALLVLSVIAPTVASRVSGRIPRRAPRSEAPAPAPTPSAGTPPRDK